ncbi:MAG: tetratricopeptide repeat protein, partial [Gammaproteobacteria bacterium]|nr:tetratricopeptide repeat protein [Gammaproteobacteria bacterium]
MSIEQKLTIAKQFHTQKQWDKAKEVYLQILAQHPEHLVTRQLLSIVYLQMDNLADSYTQIMTLLRLAPNEPNYYHHKGVIEKQKTWFPEAICSFAKALELNPKFTIALNDLACLFYELGKYDQALEQFEHLSRLQSHDAQSWYSYALT